MAPFTRGNIAISLAAEAQFLKTVRRIEELQQGVQSTPFVAPDAFLPWLQQLKAEATK